MTAWLLAGVLVVLVLLAVQSLLARRRSRRSAFAAPAPLTGDLESDVRALVERGQKIQAIKRVRQETGLGLREAKAAVDGLAATGALQVATPAVLPHAPAAGQFDWAALQEIARIRDGGNAIGAIKRARELGGLSLAQAKALVESLPRA